MSSGRFSAFSLMFFTRSVTEPPLQYWWREGGRREGGRREGRRAGGKEGGREEGRREMKREITANRHNICPIIWTSYRLKHIHMYVYIPPSQSTADHPLADLC